MNYKELFKQYRNKLMREAVVKAVLFGLAIGFGAMFALGLVFFFIGFKIYWLLFLAFGVAAAISGVLAFFLKYKPSDKQIARRIDELGLYERAITMQEFQNETDYIYERQREDTASAIKNVNATLIKLSIPLALLIILPFAAVLGTGATMLSALSAEGIIDNGQEIIQKIEDERSKRYFEVTYIATEGGFIIEEEVQLIEEGKNGNAVMAVAEDEWAFVSWSDGNEEPVRVDANVREERTIYAIFAPANGDSPFQGEGDKKKEGDQPSDNPGKGEPGQADQPSEQDSEEEGGMAAGGKYEPANQIIDGETYYGGDLYLEYYNKALEALAEEGNTDNGEADFINDYFKSIAE